MRKTSPDRKKEEETKTPVRKKNVQEFSYEAVDDKEILLIIEKIRNGISFQEFNRILLQTPFSLKDWAQYLQVSERTMQRNQKEKKVFQPVQSEKILELSMLYKFGVEVFGGSEGFDAWLEAPSVALGGRRPKDLLDTRFGVELVKDAIGRIEHGVLA